MRGFGRAGDQGKYGSNQQCQPQPADWDGYNEAGAAFNATDAAALAVDCGKSSSVGGTIQLENR